MKGSALVFPGVVREVNGPDGPVLDIAVTADHFIAQRQKAAKKWGLGCALTFRVEPEEDALVYGQLKHLYGHLYAPVSRRTGETVAEVHLRMKASYMPDDGRTSITQLTRDEVKAFIESVEQDIRENDPDSWDDCVAAMSLFERLAG